MIERSYKIICSLLLLFVLIVGSYVQIKAGDTSSNKVEHKVVETYLNNGKMEQITNKIVDENLSFSINQLIFDLSDEEKHVVQFVTNVDEVTIPVRAIAENDLIEEPDSLTRDGYTLEGWYTEDSFENKWDFANDRVMSPLTLHARWVEEEPQANMYVVQFVTNVDEVTIPVRAIAENDLIEEPDSLIKDGYTLEGWYTEDSFENKWDFANDRVMSPLTLHARWVEEELQANMYVVQFVTNVDGVTIPVRAIAENDLIEEPDSLTRDGYTLEGWYTEDSFENKWDFANNRVMSSLTLHAKWVESSDNIEGENPTSNDKDNSQKLDNNSYNNNDKQTDLPNSGYNTITIVTMMLIIIVSLSWTLFLNNNNKTNE